VTLAGRLTTKRRGAMNSTPKPVPSDASAARSIDATLKGVIKKIYDGQPFQTDISIVEDYLRERELLISSGKLDPSYDWNGDLRVAQTAYKVAIDWLPQHRNIREGYLVYWRNRTERAAETLTKISLEGLKTILVLHGAVALGALNILTDKEAVPLNLLAAKCALAFSLVGIIMLGLGQIIVVRAVSSMNDRIAGEISTIVHWKKLSAIGRYWRRGYKLIQFADYLIYGSIFWFGIYTAILCIILISV